MLEYLSIANYAIIEDLRLEPGPGFNTITGETGAGKSILLGALKLALGERASVEALRRGAARANVEAVFRNLPPTVSALLRESGLDDDGGDDCVILRREIASGGASRAFINGRTVTAAQLRGVADQLIDIHSQNEHTSLHEPLTQLRLVDRFGEHDGLLAAYRSAFDTMRAAQHRLAALDTDRDDAERRKGFLEFQIDEIRRVSPLDGEDEALDHERRRLQHAERIVEACAAACDMLYEGEQTGTPAAALVDSARRRLDEVATLDPSQGELAARAGEVRFTLEDLAARVRDYAAGVSGDPAHLAVVDERLHQLNDLKRKYGRTLADVLATLTRLEEEHRVIEFHDEELAKALRDFASAAGAALEAARNLQLKRRKTATGFEKRVMQEMRDLELPRARFVVQLTGRIDGLDAATPPTAVADALTAQGGDDIEFLVSANAGEDPKPLRRVASGGEIARIMLAVKAVLAGRDEIPTLVFDEIDVGISGEAAARVGEKLRRLAESHQVLCITHLPQVAARGHDHWLVEKRVAQGRTNATARRVTDGARVDAIAEMLSGREPDAAALGYARELLARGAAG